MSIPSTQMQSVLQQGLDTLDLNQQIMFTQYNRIVLPLDGYVFWKPGQQFSVPGSLHYAQEWQQSEDEAVGYSSILFTAETQVQEFSSSTQNALFIASAGNFRYAFSQQSGFYQQAGLWHYVGHSIYPALATQLLDPPVTINLNALVLSNSVPFWLQLGSYKPIYGPLANTIPVFPAYMVAENQIPPYIVANVEATEMLQALPSRGIFGTHTQWASDRVLLTFYGLQNDAVLNFQDCINQYSEDTDNFGIMEEAVVYDDRRIEPELHGPGMKKSLRLVVSYLQSVAQTLSFQLIKTAVPTVTINPSGV